MNRTFRRITAVSLILTLIFAFSANANVAECSAVRTVDEILDEYREACKNFEQNAEAASLACVGLTKESLTENTVNELNAAGYEAYKLTPDNHEAIEMALATDLDELRLDPNGNYLIVVSGGNLNSRAAGNSFSYTYGGQTYTLRELTVTAEDGGSGYAQADTYNCLTSSVRSVISACLDTAIWVFDKKMGTDLGTVSDICGLVISNFGFTNSSTLTFNAGTSWTRVYTQVYDSYDQAWAYGSSVERAYCRSYMSGYYYDADDNCMTPVPSDESDIMKYSSNYFNSTWKHQQAVISFINGNPCNYDSTDDITYKYGNRTVITHDANF